MTVLVPVMTVSEANKPGHTKHGKARRARAQRRTTHLTLMQHRRPRRSKAGGFTITVTRQCPPRNKIRDDDNLGSALKAVRDGVADYLGVDDGADTLTWNCRQRTGKKYGVEITIEPGPVPRLPTTMDARCPA